MVLAARLTEGAALAPRSGGPVPPHPVTMKRRTFALGVTCWGIASSCGKTASSESRSKTEAGDDLAASQEIAACRFPGRRTVESQNAKRGVTWLPNQRNFPTRCTATRARWRMARPPNERGCPREAGAPARHLVNIHRLAIQATKTTKRKATMTEMRGRRVAGIEGTSVGTGRGDQLSWLASMLFSQ